MEFREVTLPSVGVRGIVPQGWVSLENGQYAQRSVHGGVYFVWQRACPHIDPEGVMAALGRMSPVDVLRERVGTLQTARLNWDLYTISAQVPEIGHMTASLALAQEGTWTYMAYLATPPDEHETLYDAVLLPVTEAFTPYTHAFGLMGGGEPPAASAPETGATPTLAERLGYTRQDILVLVHADDVAAHPDQTDGTLEAMAVGMCKTGSVMVPCPDFERLLAIWQQRPDLDLGIHLTLNSEWGPGYGWPGVLPQSQVPSLYGPDGLLWPTLEALKEHMVVREALCEMEAQIERVLEADVAPTHVDDHMGCYWQHPDLAEGVSALALAHNLPMSPGDDQERMRAQGYVFPDASWLFTYNLIGDDVDPSIRFKVYDDWLRGLEPGVHRVLTHIARMSDGYRSKIFGAWFRQGDYDYWTRPETRALADELGITFIGYRELQRVQGENWGLGEA
jgi:predicted glycoside hydrolase/deacetylase ChbG (UPF0249 family)